MYKLCAGTQKSLEDLANDEQAQNVKNAQLVQEKQDHALARARKAGLSAADAQRQAEAAVEDLLATLEAAKKREQAAASSSQPRPLGSHSLETLVLGSNLGYECSVTGVCMLPLWAMNALGVNDGEEVVIEPLQLPLNKAGRPMVASPQGHSWHCGAGLNDIKGLKDIKDMTCRPYRPACNDCRAITSVDLSGGVLLCVAMCCRVLQCVAVCCSRSCPSVPVFLNNTLQHPATHCNTLQHKGLALAHRVSWRLPNHNNVGDLEATLGNHLGHFMV